MAVLELQGFGGQSGAFEIGVWVIELRGSFW